NGNNNPFVRVDPIFALLGNGAANTGIAQDNTLVNAAQKDPECLQQNIADECVSNAKRANNMTAVAVCMQFRALERNTIGIGLVSNQCNQTPKNAELVGIKQHQDPAADGATAANKQVEIDLAKKIFALGAFSAEQSANFALQTSTFAPGSKADNTFKGNTCDDEGVKADRAGEFFGRVIAVGQDIDCITKASLANGQSKAVPAANKAEIIAALGAGGAGNGNQGNQGNNNGNQGNQGNQGNNNQGNGNQGNQGNQGNNQGNNLKSKAAEAAKLLQQALTILNSL
ncbi:hypothetical protein HDU67_009244, partial [Dinochytrium kinnereticum]